MHLKSIAMKGFKSFPERTRLTFSPGVSVIVGPNGCGKSNITDAVLWALGEQSPTAVRGQTMQDVIFAGGEGQGRRRYAEVEVVIDNTDGAADTEFSEISIRRRLDRSGEGEYRLNGARCRLIDVLETLSEANLGGEMHSVISQGKVEEVVHSKPHERRLLVEEAAGLGKHRKRRRRAELKLDRTRDNLDRALDVEREARSHLRPLKRQAQAAETHARLERQAMELRAPLVADELGGHERELAKASGAAQKARGEREELEAKLADVNRRRTEIEERFAQRDRERTRLWGRLTALRAAHERLSVRAESLAARQADLASGLERRREALGALAAEADDAGEDDPIEVELGRIEQSLGAATRALLRARAGEGEIGEELGRVREGAERAARAASRAEGLLGRNRQDSLERRVAAEQELLVPLRSIAEAVAQSRDAVGRRVAALEDRMLGSHEADDVTDELRACSREEYELQAKLREVAEAVTEAEVRAAHISDRRDEVAAELQRIASRLGEELGPAPGPLVDAEREEIEAKLERLARRREQLGPVNPLAEREYEEARAHVEELEAQREDLESALAELEKLIRDTDRKIRSEFEQTLEAAGRNFEELVEHLFPGGRGRLRLVDAPGPRAVPPFAGARTEPSAEEAEAEDGDEPADDDGKGVEIEVTPAGKATRRLSLLSGGEKSLVALAFLFAVFLARPSPFYILDEVEAALDDANIDRFLQLVRRFSDRAQFVIVTHQKRTMDAADVLYGVSMGEGGVTKVVSRRLPQDGDAERLPAEDEPAAGARRRAA
ncbi:MAG TPA: AAA family ATPase [Solirubrobacterales bacterium]|nr:AAA family ATPase [Solirubrobacterales bacterium]